jgi:hypothetical protein
MYKCRVCGKEFKKPYQLAAHVKSAGHRYPPVELIKQGVEATPPQQAEQPVSEALLESKAVEIGEVLEVEADELNIRLRINPNIFYLYEIFKAEVKRRGNEWHGELGDFLYMAAKDALAIHGIYPSVVVLKSGQTLAVKEGE